MPAFEVSDEERRYIAFDVEEAIDPDYEDSLWNDWVDVKRTPEFDDFEETGFVPVGLLIQQYGWQVDCHECGTPVDNEEWDHRNDKRIHPVYRGRICFCSNRCASFEDVYQETRGKPLEDAKAALLSKYPWATIKASRVVRGSNAIQVELTHPSLKRSVDWDSRQPNVLEVSREDEKTWIALTNGQSRPAWRGDMTEEEYRNFFRRDSV